MVQKCPPKDGYGILPLFCRIPYSHLDLHASSIAEHEATSATSLMLSIRPDLVYACLVIVDSSMLLSMRTDVSTNNAMWWLSILLSINPDRETSRCIVGLFRNARWPMILSLFSVKLCRPCEVALDLLPSWQQGVFNKENGQQAINKTMQKGRPKPNP